MAGDYSAVIEETAGRVLVRLLDNMINYTEPPLNVTLYQGIPKGDKMEYIIQKAVELRVKKIVPVMTEEGCSKA